MNLPILKSSAPLVGSGVLGLILAFPGQAATFSQSVISFEFSNFSHQPFGAGALTDTDTDTVARAGEVEAITDAFAEFNAAAMDAIIAENAVFSQVSGTGRDYEGSAVSLASLLGSFEVGASDTFGFDFTGSVELAASVDSVEDELASAVAFLGFTLVDGSGALVDGFGFSAALNTPGAEDTPAFARTSDFGSFHYTLSGDLGGTQETIVANFTGSYSRSFDQALQLTLEESKFAGASAAAEPAPPASVPEPGMVGGLLVLIGGYTVRRRVA